MTINEESVATLVIPDDYLHQLNSLAGLTTQNLLFLKRKILTP